MVDERQNWTRALGDNVRRVRAEKNLTLRELAAKAQITLQHLSRVELGEADVSASTVCLLAIGLDVHPGRLFYDPGSTLVGGNEERRALLEQGKSLLDRMDTPSLRIAVGVLDVAAAELIGRPPEVGSSKRRGRPRRVEESQ